MNSFLTKAGALVLVCLNTSLIFGAATAPATAEISLTQVLDDTRNASVATLPFSQCVLDFSTPMAIAASSAKIGVHLLVDKADGALNLTDIAYITFEGVAAGSRSNPAKFGKLAQYFADQNAVYSTFGRVMGGIAVGTQDLSVLGNLQTCTTFVQTTVSTNLPALLTQLGAPASDQSDIVLLATVFTPVFAQLLNKTYGGAVAAGGAVFSNFVTTVEDDVAGCGCFGRKSTAVKTTPASAAKAKR